MVLVAVGIHHIVQPVCYSPHRSGNLGAVCHIAAVDEQTLTPAGEQRRIGLTYIQKFHRQHILPPGSLVAVCTKDGSPVDRTATAKSASTSGTIFRVFAQVFMAFSSTSYKFCEVACNLSFIYVIIVFAIGQVSITKRFEGGFSKKWTDG